MAKPLPISAAKISAERDIHPVHRRLGQLRSESRQPGSDCDRQVGRPDLQRNVHRLLKLRGSAVARRWLKESVFLRGFESLQLLKQILTLVVLRLDFHS